MDFSTVSSTTEDFASMDGDELLETEAIGSNRVETAAAGSTIIHTLMKQFNFEKVIVSAQGLREGILSAFIRDPKSFYKGKLGNEMAKAYVTFACQVEMLPEYTVGLVRQLVNSGLLREKEKMILTHAIKQTSGLPIMTNLNNLFYLMIDEDSSFLSHREQLVLAISIIYAKKAKTAEWLISRYRSILEPQNRDSIRKIAACLEMSSILERSRISVRLAARGNKMDMKLVPVSARQFIPSTLITEAVRKFEQAFDIGVNCAVVTEREKILAIGKSKQRVGAA
jgi:exopolyphosphatase/pppGpp-phosphohydrolase